jgi:hypothetical protein
VIGRSEFSVLTKCLGPEGTLPPGDEQLAVLRDALPGTDKLTQYPPASGRGHAFETRFWIEAADAADAASQGLAAVTAGLVAAGLDAWPVVRVHAASLGERAIEGYPGFERRRPLDPDWSVMHRSELPDGDSALDASDRAALLAVLPGMDRVVEHNGRVLEARFWVSASDAVAAAAVAHRAVTAALARIGRLAGTTIRLQTASVAERDREAYRGLERRLDGLGRSA